MSDLCWGGVREMRRGSVRAVRALGAAALVVGSWGLLAPPGAAAEGDAPTVAQPRSLALGFLGEEPRRVEPAIAHLAVSHAESAASFVSRRAEVDDTTTVRDAVESLRMRDRMPGVQRSLKALGFASVALDGRQSEEFRNILCSWREAVGEEPSRERLTLDEARRIQSMTRLPRPRRYMVVGLNVNLRCQSLAWVVDGGTRYQRLFRVSTGAIGLSTSAGYHVIERRIDGLHNSSAYPSPYGWNMYRPAYFTSWGEALHGGVTSSSVLWFPSSHGCVRMLHPDIDYLWRKGGNAIGTSVYVYGAWQG